MELPDSLLTVVGVGVPILLGFLYFTIARKDKSKFDTQSNMRTDEETERDKQELARKVKKELQDEADKVEKLRKDVAVDVKEETNAVTDQKLREQRLDYEHKVEMNEERLTSKFTAMDKVMNDLIIRMVSTAEVQAGALIKINESIEALRKLFYEVSGRVNKVEREQDTQRQ